MKDPLGVSPGKGNQETTRGKEKDSFDLGGNQYNTIQYNLLINSPTGVFQNQFTYNNGKK